MQNQLPMNWPKNSRPEKLYIGIDPGRNTGVAVYSSAQKKIIDLKTLDFWGVIAFLKELKLIHDTNFEVVMENPGLNSFIYSRNHHENATIKLKMAQDVGRNKEQAFLIIDYLKMNNITFREVRPTTAKWKADIFNRYTGWTGNSNEHTRDAGRLVYNL
jgi:hypothetical protein